MFAKTCTGSAKPCGRKRSCQDGDVWETFEALNGIVSGFNNWYFLYDLAPSSVYRQPTLQTALSLAAAPECFCH